MANPDYAIVDGFDHYTEAGDATLDVRALINREWGTTTADLNFSTTIRAALNGPASGCSLYLTKTGGNANSGPCGLGQGVGGNRARCVGGMTFQANVPDNTNGISFFDSTTAQLSIGVNASGFVEVRRGGFNGTIIATSTSSLTLSSPNCIEWDITFHNTTGIIKVWMNGTLNANLNLTGQDTCSTANNYFNSVLLGFFYSSASTARYLAIDHFYLYSYTAAGGSETPLGMPIAETSFGTSDDTAQFIAGPGVLGKDYRTTTATVAPGANQLVLRQFTADANATLDNVRLVPAATSATAKFKAVLYADSSGSPGALTATGTEVTGCTSGSTLTLPFAAGQSLTSGTTYWIGYITDTSIAIQRHDSTTTLGQSKANTYTSGAPNPAGSMTAGQPTWQIWGTLSSVAANFCQTNKREPTTLEYNYETTVGDKDLYGFPALSVTPSAIHAVCVKAAAYKPDGGARTLSMDVKSGGTTSAGDRTAQSPPLAITYLSSHFFLDPNGSIAWTKTNLDASKSGVEIAS